MDIVIDISAILDLACPVSFSIRNGAPRVYDILIILTGGFHFCAAAAWKGFTYKMQQQVLPVSPLFSDVQ